MKKYIVALLITAAFIKPALAQKGAYETMVDGVKVIVQPSGNNILVIQTLIKGGVQNYPADKAGIESLALNSLSECGTLKHDKNSFKDALDKVSANVYGYAASKDYSIIQMNCIKSDFSTVWPLYTEAITEPKFDTTDFRIVKNDALSGLKMSESSPDRAIDNMANKTAFAGRDFAKNPAGTTETIKGITAADAKAYYRSILTKSRMVIVIVGDLDKATIESSVRGLLANIKKGEPYNMKESFFRVYNNSFVAESRDLATNYVEGVTSGPQLDAPDYYAFQIAMAIFYDRHFLDIRTKNGLSYAPQVFFAPGSTTVTKIRVSTTKPNDYIHVFDKLVDSTKKHGFEASELANEKTSYLTRYYYNNETNASLASSIAANEILHGDWKRALTVMNYIKTLKVEDLNDAFNKYIGNIVWVYQGDPKKVDPKFFINGTLKNADNPVSN